LGKAEVLRRMEAKRTLAVKFRIVVVKQSFANWLFYLNMLENLSKL
jgi:hypothetical protein